MGHFFHIRNSPHYNTDSPVATKSNCILKYTIWPSAPKSEFKFKVRWNNQCETGFYREIKLMFTAHSNTFLKFSQASLLWCK